MRNKSCFKLMNISDSDILGNFKITLTNNVYRESVFLWNKYQIFIIDLHDYNKACIEILFSFDTPLQILASYHYLICLDQNGVVWKAIIKFINLPIPEVTPHFVKLQDNTISLVDNEDGQLLFAIKNVLNSFNLLVYNFKNFSVINSFDIKNIFNDTNYSKCKMYCHSILKDEKLFILNINATIVYYFFIDINNRTNKCIEPEKLIVCPTEISDIQCINQNILISLSIGTIYKIDLKTLTSEPTQVIHFNTAIHKMVAINDYLLYSDGLTMWRADNIYSKEDIHFKQIFVKLVKDFVYFDKQNEILCTTYMKNLYRFSLDDETAFMNPLSTKEYCTSKQLLGDMSCMQDIVSEIEKNDEMTKKIKMEENFITTLALANRHDIVSDIIHFEMAVHENCEDIIQNYKLLTLTNNIKDYHVLNSYYLLMKLMVTPVFPKFTDILSDLFGKFEIHITIFSDNKLLKTFTLKVIEQLKSMNIVVPLTYLKNTKITVCVKLVTNIPGALDRKQTLWVTLYANETVLSSEHFIKTILPSSNICHLKKPSETIDNLICENASKLYGNLFKFNKIKNNKNSLKWKLYVKLPKKYEELFRNDNFYKHLNAEQRKLLISVMSTDNFLKSGNSISLNIGNEKVEIVIDSGFSNPVLITECVNFQVATDIRDFISNLLHEQFYKSSEEFVTISIFNTLENIERDFKALSTESAEKILELHENFQKNVIIALNI